MSPLQFKSLQSWWKPKKMFVALVILIHYVAKEIAIESLSYKQNSHIESSPSNAMIIFWIHNNKNIIKMNHTKVPPFMPIYEVNKIWCIPMAF
jgi:hypothetical protein